MMRRRLREAPRDTEASLSIAGVIVWCQYATVFVASAIGNHLFGRNRLNSGAIRPGKPTTLEPGDGQIHGACPALSGKKIMNDRWLVGTTSPSLVVASEREAMKDALAIALLGFLSLCLAAGQQRSAANSVED